MSGSNGIAPVDSQTLDTIAPPANELPALKFASPSLDESPEFARPFDLNSRLKSALVDYERGKVLLAEVESTMAEAMKGYNEQRATIAREMLRIEGAIVILREQGAKES